MSTVTSPMTISARLSEISVHEGWRKSALEQLVHSGLPGSKHEEYRFTPILKTLEKHAAELEFNPNPADAQGHASSLPVPACTVIIRNGHPEIPSELPAGISMHVERDWTEQKSDDSYALLNQILAPARLVIGCTSADGATLHIHHISGGAKAIAVSPVVHVKIEDSCKLTLVDSHSSANSAFVFLNASLEVHVGTGSEFTLVSLQNNTGAHTHIQHTTIRQKAGSTVHSFVLTSEGSVIRNNTSFILEGSGAEANLNGLYLLGGKTLADNHTVVDHRVPDANSNELYKGVMAGNSRGVFNGKIFVRQDAQRTNAFQSNRNILLSEDAGVHTKPQLEIWADDVKCSHGCTTGQLDEEALFYLLSRGIDKQEAQAMLLEAFASDAINLIRDEQLRHWVRELALEKINRLK